MITPELLKDPDYQLVLRIAESARREGDAHRAWWIEQYAQSGELAIALYDGMDFLVEHDIPVSYDDYKILESWFYRVDEPGWDPDLDCLVEPHEAEVFSRLKVTGIGRVRQ